MDLEIGLLIEIVLDKEERWPGRLHRKRFAGHLGIQLVERRPTIEKYPSLQVAGTYEQMHSGKARFRAVPTKQA